MKSDYYDDYFEEGHGFELSYKKSYYWVHWTQVIKFLGENKNKNILEIGCGTGQLTQYLFDEGFSSYYGFDFSKRAIELAKKRMPNTPFFQADALDIKSYPKSYDTVICLEVLEHVEQDLSILANITLGVETIFSVPNFLAPSHVRRFLTERSIKKRYYKLVDIDSIVRIGNIFIVKGIRSNFRPNLLQRFLKSREPINLDSFLKRIQHRINNILHK